MSASRTTRAASIFLAAVTVALSGVLSAPTAVQAQATAPGAASVSVSPPTTELDAAAGDTVTRRVSVINGSAAERKFNASVKNFQAAGESGEAALSDEENPYALKAYMSVAPTNATIGAGKTQDFTVTIKLPKDVGPGSRYGAVVFTPQTTSDPNANLSVVSEVSSLFLVRVPGQANEKASIASFETHQYTTQDGKVVAGEKQGFFQKGPVDFQLRIKNDGNVGLKPTAKVTITNMFGKTVQTVDATPQNSLPNAIRKYDIRWDHNTLLGRYKAKVVVSYGTTGQTMTTSATFWGAPLKTIGIILVVLILLFLLLWLPRKRLRAALRALASSGAAETAAKPAEPAAPVAEAPGGAHFDTTPIPPEDHNELGGEEPPRLSG